MQRESSWFAFCGMGRDQLLVRSWRRVKIVQTHKWRYCTSYFPSTSFPGNGSSSAGVSAVLFERDEGDRDDDPILDKGGLTGTVRLWPNRAAAVCVDSTELDRPPISDGGATWQRQTEERTNGC
jgi:hypothetical protein